MANKGILEINDILNEYSRDIQEGITNVAIEIAENGKNELRNTINTYQVRSGKYNKGWKVEKRSGKGFVHTTIHNTTNYQLTHLLEKGHDWVGRDGKRKKNAAKAFVHIEPVEQKCIKAFERDVEQIIKNGG